MEVTAFVEAHGHLTDEAGRRRVVRHGYLPEREIQTGIGPVAVRQPRVRDRGADVLGGEIRFTSAILPPYLRRTRSIEELLPWLYLKGISTGDFGEALAALLGPEGLITGSGATCRPGVTSTSGPMASTSRPGWIRTGNASW
jgi:hypothetical protein